MEESHGQKDREKPLYRIAYIAGLPLLTVLAVLGNYLNFQLFFNVDLIFGSIAAMMVLYYYGPVWAVVVAGIGASYTYLLWNHPYAIVIFTCEMIFVAFAYKRLSKNMVLMDTLYWIVFGMPMVFFFYHIVMHMDLSASLLIMLKQSTNGIFNTLVAVLLISLASQFLTKPGKHREESVPMSRFLFVAAVAFVFFPALIITMVSSRLQVRSVQEDVQTMLSSMSGSAQTTLRNWFNEDVETVRKIGEWYLQYGGTETYQEDLHPSNRIMVGDHFNALGVWDFSEPPPSLTNIIGHGDYLESTIRLSEESFEKENKRILLRLNKKTEAEKSTQMVIISPIRRGSEIIAYSYGAISKNRIDVLLKGVTSSWTTDAALIDTDRNIIACTGGAEDAIYSFLTGEGGSVSTVNDEIALWTPAAQENRSVMTRWSSSIYIQEKALNTGMGLHILLAAGVAPYETRLHRWSLYVLAAILTLVIVAIFVAAGLSKRLLQPLSSLTSITRDLPYRVESGETIEWPPTYIAEVNALIEHFRAMSHSLTGKFVELKKTNRELTEAKHKADSANRAKSEFLANMSHEFRTPMNSIIGLTSLLMESDLESRESEYVKYINDSAYSLLNLINSILDFSKVEAGSIEIHETAFSIRELLRSAMGLLRVQADRKNLSLGWEVEDKVPETLVGDQGKLLEILNNLLGNSINYTDEGGVNLEVSLEEKGGKEAFLRFRIRDTGRGITPEQLERVFESFTRGGEGKGRQSTQGTGLGLAIVKKLTEKMGGSIRVDSTEGVGSNFEVDLPFKLRSVQEEQEAISKAEEPPLKGLSILVAEDQKANILVIQNFLLKDDHQVVVAGNGYEAIEALEKQHFDIVLMDVQMPEMDGLEAIKRIRAHDGSTYDPKVPIIALTAYARAEDRERLLQTGANEYVTKPVDMQALRQAFLDVGTHISDAPIEDKKNLQILFNESPDVLRSIIRIFLDEVPKQLRTLETAVQEGDAKTIDSITHSLINTSGAIEAAELTQDTRALESRARAGKLESLEPQLRKIQEDFQEVKTSLLSMQQKLDSQEKTGE